MSGERFIRIFINDSNDFDLLKLDGAWCLRHKRDKSWTLAAGAKHMSFKDACEKMKQKILKRMFRYGWNIAGITAKSEEELELKLEIMGIRDGRE